MAKGTLLLVDDEPMILKNLSLTLEDLADEILTAGNGLEALEQLEKHEVHCVVCDINMPKLNGVEVIKRIRAKGSDVPFIFFSGHGSRELMLEAAKHGAFDFLEKPLLEGLEEVITRGLKQGLALATAEGESFEEGFQSEYRKLLKELSEK